MQELSGVEFMDSTGLGVLVGAQTDSNGRGGSLALVAPHPWIQKMLRITKLHKVFTVYPTLDDLVATLS